MLAADWASPAGVKADFGNASILKDGRVVFNVADNKCRLVVWINYAYRVVKAKWTSQELISFLAGIKFTGIDEVGIVNNITNVISAELNVNMRSISFDTNDGTFDGTVMVFVHDTNHLTELMKKLKKVNGVLSVTRIDSSN